MFFGKIVVTLWAKKHLVVWEIGRLVVWEGLLRHLNNINTCNMKKRYWMMICSVLCMLTMGLCGCSDDMDEENAGITVDYVLGKLEDNKVNRSVTFRAVTNGFAKSNIEKIEISIRAYTQLAYVATVSNQHESSYSHTASLPLGTQGEYYAEVFLKDGKKISTENKTFKVE